MKDPQRYDRPVRSLRILLATLLLAGMMVIALGAVGHSHTDVHQDVAGSAQFVDSGAAATIAAPAERGQLETDGVCFAVVLVALVLMTLLQALLAHPASSSALARSRTSTPDLPEAALAPRAPDLAVLAVCRQ